MHRPKQTEMPNMHETHEQIHFLAQRPTTEASKPTTHYQYGINIWGKLHNHSQMVKVQEHWPRQ